MFQTEKDISDVRDRVNTLPDGDFKKTALAVLDVVAHERRGDAFREIALIMCHQASAYVDRENSTGEIVVYVDCNDLITAEAMKVLLYVRDSPDTPRAAHFGFALLVKHPARAMANAG